MPLKCLLSKFWICLGKGERILFIMWSWLHWETFIDEVGCKLIFGIIFWIFFCLISKKKELSDDRKYIWPGNIEQQRSWELYSKQISAFFFSKQTLLAAFSTLLLQIFCSEILFVLILYSLWFNKWNYIFTFQILKYSLTN